MKYNKAGAVTPHDTTDQTIDTKYGTAIDAIYVGVGGNMYLTLSQDSAPVLFKNAISGTIYPLSAKLILASSGGTATTATDLVKLDTGGKYD